VQQVQGEHRQQQPPERAHAAGGRARNGCSQQWTHHSHTTAVGYLKQFWLIAVPTTCAPVRVAPRLSLRPPHLPPPSPLHAYPPAVRLPSPGKPRPLGVLDQGGTCVAALNLHTVTQSCAQGLQQRTKALVCCEHCHACSLTTLLHQQMSLPCGVQVSHACVSIPTSHPPTSPSGLMMTRVGMPITPNRRDSALRRALSAKGTMSQGMLCRK
jgi:hypothetical protein